MDDVVIAGVQFGGSAIGTLQVSWVKRPGFDDFTTIHYERGAIRIPSQGTDPVHVAERRRSGPVVWGRSGVVETVQHGGQPSVPGTEGKATLAAVLAAYGSASQSGGTYPMHA